MTRLPPGAAAARRALVVAGLFVLILAACGGDDDSPADVPPPDAEEATELAGGGNDEGTATDRDPTPVSFAEDVQPLVESVCARCHTAGGPGTGHVSMDTAGDVAANAVDIASAVLVGAMPPWPASDLGPVFRDDWSLSEDQIDTITAWAAAGAELDVPPSLPMEASAGTVALADPDVVLTPSAGYAGASGRPDEYRCFVYDPALASPAHIEGFEFVPDQASVVHHAIGYRIPADRRGRADELDGADGQQGWSCFGGSRLGVNDIFLGWAPGQAATEFDGAGLAMQPGDFLVVQIHYHFEVDAPADRSALALRWSDTPGVDDVSIAQYVAPAEIPCLPDESGPLCDRDAAMERAIERYGPEGVQADLILGLCGLVADEVGVLDGTIARASCDQPVLDAGHVVSVLGHMHETGATFRMTLNPDTPDERVLLDIPDWDFDWQFNYEPVEDLVVKAGDRIRVECSWDRALRDPGLEPAYVFWADGTDDEMCFATITTTPLDGGEVGDAAAGFFDHATPFPPDVQECVRTAVGADDAVPGDELAAALLGCDDPAAVGARAAAAVGGIVVIGLPEDLSTCLAERYAEPGPLAEILDAHAAAGDAATVRSAAETFADCVRLGTMITAALPQLELSPGSVACLDEQGRDDVVGIFAQALGGPATGVPSVLFTCLTPDERERLTGG